MVTDTPLEAAILASLDGLLKALRLEHIADDMFRVPSEPGRFADRVYGGQFLAQALVAASATVAGKEPDSLHAAFVQAGVPDLPVDLSVLRVRDGRSTATRRVTALQKGKPLLEAIVSFHANSPTPDVYGEAPVAPPPEDLPLLQDWAAQVPGDGPSRSWIERPPPLEIRIGEALTFLGGAQARGTRSHWMRVPRDIGDDPVLHSALLAYASDFFLMDVVFRAHPDGAGIGSFAGFSLDHAIWFHRPVRFDRWHLHTQEALAVVGERGLARGALYDTDGRLVASVMQEVLVRKLGKP